MASKAGPPAKAQLPNKEQSLFRQVVKHYETKQYKKGIKTADTILKKFPEHGETLAMKGLLLNCLDRKEEAYELVKLGVKNDLRSHVCWHVYGLVYRSDRNYDEAIKCYKNALRLDKENVTVMRDLALLQIQLRDLHGFLETRQTLLELKSNNKQNWVCFALAHHLCGHHEVAVNVLASLQATLPDDETATPADAYEHSELLLYKARVLEEGGMHEEALAVLEEGAAKRRIKDRLGMMEQQGRLLLALGRHAESEALYRRLLGINVENYRYHDGLRAALQLAPTAVPSSEAPQPGTQQAARLQAAYAELQAEHLHSVAVRRLPLDFLQGDEFVAAADAYVRRYLSKGIPSLFSDMRRLYCNPAKAQALGSLFARLEASLAATGDFPPLHQAAATAAAAAQQQHEQQQQQQQQHGGHHASPQSLVWCRLYLAQHHDLLRDTAEALRLVDSCLEHTPTLVEAHSVRARILKHAGDVEGAARVADAARRMDLADRYLNCVAVKALFRAGHLEQAERTAALFTRDGEQANNLFDMQATWYEISSGRAYLAAGQMGPALKRLLRVDAHWADFTEDQFDFHGYCVRKQTLRAYCDMLATEDRLYAHPTYLKAMSGAVAAYLRIADGAAAGGAAAADEAGMERLSAEEQKRVRQKKRKEEQRRQKEDAEAAAKAAAEAAAAEKAGGKKGAADGKKKDPDPHGAQLAATPDPLGEAAKLVHRLCEHAGGELQTHLLAFEVFSRRGKLLLALRAVRQAVKLVGAEDPRAHGLVVRMALVAQAAQQAAAGGQAAGSSSSEAAEIVAEVVQEQLPHLLHGAGSPAAYHRTWTEAQGCSSLQHRAVAAELSALLDPAVAVTAAQRLVEGGMAGASHKEAVAVHHLLRDRMQQPEAAAAWKAAAAQVFRLSRYFGGPDVVELPPFENEVEANGLSHSMEALTV